MRVYLNSVKKAHLKSVISYSILPADATIFETERVHVAPGKESPTGIYKKFHHGR
jgi:hypothetical protein